MAYDRNLLKFKDVAGFQAWLDENQLAWRPGKGENQVMQVKLKDGWPAVCVNAAKTVVTTAPAMREMIQRFNKGMPYTGKTPRTEPADGFDEFLQDLWDDYAMHALQGILGRREHSFDTPQAYAHLAASYADAMMAERAKRVTA